MSLWGKLAGVGQMIAGGALMATGVGGPAGSLLLSSGASTLAGGIGASASKKAAEQQLAAGERAAGVLDRTYQDARGVADRVYQQQTGALSPYMQLGAGASGTLGSLVGLPPISAPPPMSGGMPPASQPMNPAMPSSGDGGGAARAPEATPQMQAAMRSQSSYGGRSLGDLTGDLVVLQAPDGSTRAVPSSQAPFYIARGARPAGGAVAPQAERI